MPIQLYSWPRSSGTRASWALEELGVPYEYVELNREKEEHLAPKYLAINPQGKVPALVDGDQKFFESGAIVLHLGFKYGVDKKLWPAAGSQARADALCWTVWSLTELWANTMQYAYHGLDTPMSYDPADRSKAHAEYSLSQLNRELGALEARLQKQDYMLGSDFSLVDVAAASTAGFGFRIGVKSDNYPRVAAWAKRCSERPALKRAR